MLYQDTVVLLFAKAPVEGKVNTRLIPDIGVKAATKLQHDLIHDRLTMLTAAKLCDIRLMCAPDKLTEYFIECGKRYPVALFDQTGADLGERMYAGIRHALRDYEYCIVIGTDAPSLDVDVLKMILQSLHEGAGVVVVPAEDGGYVSIAMQQAYSFLFQGISWGSAEVMQQTRDKLNNEKVLFEELPACWDIDRLEDYQRYLHLHKLK
jgi:rSAM/selenodomain-associated transferase 1